MANYRFVLPDCVYLPRKTKEDKKVMLNMNIYRNLHHSLNNQVKQAFEPIETELFKAERIRISYYVYKKSKRKFDTMNVISVVDKFFLDWLVKHEYIPDDNCDNVCYGNIYGHNNYPEPEIIAEIEVLR